MASYTSLHCSTTPILLMIAFAVLYLSLGSMAPHHSRPVPTHERTSHLARQGAEPCSPASLAPVLDSWTSYLGRLVGDLGEVDVNAVMPLLWHAMGAQTTGRVPASVLPADSQQHGPVRYVPYWARFTIPSTSSAPIAAPLTYSGDPLVIDVGANVGDTTETMIALYTLTHCLKKASVAGLTELHQHCLSLKGSADVISFEPTSSTCDRLKVRGRQDGWEATGRWHVVCAAAVDRAAGAKRGSNVTFYTSNNPGDQQASLGAAQAISDGSYAVSVPAYTLDRYLAEHGLGSRPIHLLKVDAEGYDAAVLDGADGTISSGSVQFIAFEYNAKWRGAAESPRGDDRSGSTTTAAEDRMPSPYTLQAAVAWLRRRRYLCFLVTPAALLPLSGDLWRDAYEFYRWSNVLCGRREDVLWAWPDPTDPRPVSLLPGDGLVAAEADADAAQGAVETSILQQWPRGLGVLARLVKSYNSAVVTPQTVLLPQGTVPDLPDCSWAMM